MNQKTSDKIKSETALVVFEGIDIRRIWYHNEWHFSVIDVVEVLTGSSIPKRYWSDLKIKLKAEGFVPYDNIVRLKMPALDAKLRETDCANTESLFRIIQSIPSKKAEPFKRWLAEVGFQRIQEIENPELAQNRAKEYYELKGYPKDWIDKRVRGIVIRQELTDEWKKRAVKDKKEFAILTNEISKATFGIDIKKHKRIKGLQTKYKNQNLRDHMTDLELIFSMLGEKLTTETTKSINAIGFKETKKAAKEGGKVAGRARIDAEQNLNINVISKKNFLDLIKTKIKTPKIKKLKKDSN